MSTPRAPFPGFDHLYFLSDPLASRPLRAEPTDLGGAPSLEALTRADVTPRSPVRFVHAMGSKTPSDAIWTTSTVPLILGQRVVDILRERAFSGWTTYPVEVYDGWKTLVPGYYGLAVTGRCGPPDWSRSQRIVKRFPGGLFPHSRGFLFSEDSWSGSDVFMPRDGSGYITITDAVRQTLKRARVSNLLYERLDEFEISDAARGI